MTSTHTEKNEISSNHVRYIIKSIDTTFLFYEHRMGKKSRKKNCIITGITAKTATTTTTSRASLVPSESEPSASSTFSAGPVFYPSDGPSDIELLQTKSTSLQSKLDQLTELGLANDKKGFVKQFVPLNLSSEDAAGYLADLTTAPEAEGQWRNLISEIAAIRCGKGVNEIEGDQLTEAVFHFSHPLLDKCDREVSFVNINGEWRAEG